MIGYYVMMRVICYDVLVLRYKVVYECKYGFVCLYSEQSE